MAKIPDHIIDTIIQTSRIEEVIGEFVNLKRAGSNLKGLSPFTDEKTPSFVVSPGKQIFKCFSTGKGGNAVNFLMEKEHFSYPEALKWLASKYNIEIPEDEPQTAEQLAAITERESLHIINEFAKEHFKEMLHHNPEGQAVALSYFLERGFRKDIIDKFQLGYCVSYGNEFFKAATAKGYKLEYLEKLGLVKSREDRHFDFFSGRVIFPIHSVTGRVLGFGGRILKSDKKIAKYFNSPESIIYNKSEILYGLHFAKGEIIKYDNCFLVEGYTDVISMHQAGIQNVVSSSGTSLTREQIKLMRRYTQNITILYDGDNAGIKASFRGIDLILEEGMNVRVVLFPEGEDPDSYSKRVSSSELEAYIKAHTQDFISFKADILLKDDSGDASQKIKLIHEIVNSIALIPDSITRNVYTNEISQRFQVDLSAIKMELNKVRVAQGSQQKEAQEEVKTQFLTPSSLHIPPVETEEPQLEDKAKYLYFDEFKLIRLLVKFGNLALEFEQDNGVSKEIVEVSVSEFVVHELNSDDLVFENPVLRKIYDYVVEGLANNTVYKSSHFARIPDSDVSSIISTIETDRYELSSNWMSKYNIDTRTEVDNLSYAVKDALYTYKTRIVMQQIQAIQHEINSLSDQDGDRLSELLMEQMFLEKVKVTLLKELGRITT